MIPKRYPIRAIKSILLFFLLAFAIFGISFLLGNKGIDPETGNPLTFLQLIQKTNLTMLIIFFVGFGLIYPFVGYVSQKIALRRPFSESDKEVIRKLFSDARYQLIDEDNNKMVFRATSLTSRVTRLFEDKIEVDFSSNILIFDGLRRETYRLSRAADWQLRRAEEHDE